MQAPIVIIDIGELAGIFARGFLRCGHPVYPITRDMDMAREGHQIPDPCLVLLAVPEDELHPLLERLPAVWRDKVGLLQNELLRKGLYILTVNICGLADNRPVGELWRERQAWMREVAAEVLDVQEWLVGQALPREKLIAGMAETSPIARNAIASAGGRKRACGVPSITLPKPAWQCRSCMKYINSPTPHAGRDLQSRPQRFNATSVTELCKIL